MIKKILPISIFVLVLVFIVLLGLQNMLNKSGSQGTSSITPTLFQGRQSSGSAPQTGKAYSTSVKQLTSQELQKKLPIIAPNFTLDYSSPLQKYVATVADDEATNSFNDWIDQNPSYGDELQSQNIIIAKQSVQELNDALDVAEKNKMTPEKKAANEAKIFTSSFNMLLNIPFGSFLDTVFSGPTSTPPTPTPKIQTNKPPTSNTSESPQPSKSYTYYSQCSGPYDSNPLPNGCTVCEAGCGPTSVAMILSSYIDKSLTPPKTIEIMNKAGVRIGCYGSYISEIYSYLRNRGDLKVSDFIIPSEKGLTAKDVAKDLQGYTKSGWTVFVLANFKTDGGGHYFWVTDVNDGGDILAYDPYYGKQQTPPINENRYTPAPYYRYAFAVKKS
ncbi:MAG: C39 family peptidase [Candidatus Roizmanbacteria bacterium]|nr:C39 family peptidase [Candidatus Roizmanbacteria bacterium]